MDKTTIKHWLCSNAGPEVRVAGAQDDGLIGPDDWDPRRFESQADPYSQAKPIEISS